MSQTQRVFIIILYLYTHHSEECHKITFGYTEANISTSVPQQTIYQVFVLQIDHQKLFKSNAINENWILMLNRFFCSLYMIKISIVFFQ